MYICVQVHTHLCMGLIDLVVCVQYIQCVLYNAYVCVCVYVCVSGVPVAPIRQGPDVRPGVAGLGWEWCDVEPETGPTTVHHLAFHWSGRGHPHPLSSRWGLWASEMWRYVSLECSGSPAVHAGVHCHLQQRVQLGNGSRNYSAYYVCMYVCM